MRHLALIAAFVCGPALAHVGGHWQTFTGDEIKYMLNDRQLTYTTGGAQVFYSSGRTLFNAGQESWGTWEVRGDQYCSQWPPGDQWDCYTIQGDFESGGVRFIAPDGSYTEGYPPR
ncbi:hypothetical protein [Nereida sp. MMG025]|uniref:hypothetical protein n=1 Tax=Nereida sp. MMG025 TaxID=2909981 RepID=UPI001F2F3049|nr:hypothetical protein [Nereida sp. MMG025]MCF6443390.1 hypothetical protein [Nereida sp. MMG025]